MYAHSALLSTEFDGYRSRAEANIAVNSARVSGRSVDQEIWGFSDYRCKYFFCQSVNLSSHVQIVARAVPNVASRKVAMQGIAHNDTDVCRYADMRRRYAKYTNACLDMAVSRKADMSAAFSSLYISLHSRVQIFKQVNLWGIARIT